MFVSELHTQILGECAHWADRLARTDLIDGYIIDENDYTSNFLANFRREVNSRNISGLKAVAYRLPPRLERRMGADGCIVIDNGTSYKIGIFEAKWPGAQVERSPWDYVQKSAGVSHFDTQVRRQARHSGDFAIWGMFYCESEFLQQPGGYPDFGSACVEHKVLSNYVSVRNSKTPWSDSELERILSHSNSIKDVIEDICKCNLGRQLKIRPYEKAFDDSKLPLEILLISAQADVADNMESYEPPEFGSSAG
ncbi:TPA: hypothetical protein ACRNCN_002795 [Pseudomonas aeruginosa]